MPARELIIIGGGEHARVLIEAARSRPDLWVVAGFADPAPAPDTEALGVERLGDDEAVLAARRPGWQFALGVGATGVSAVRERIARRYEAAGVPWATVVHASAVVSPTAALGEGTVVFAGAVVQTRAVLGRHVVVNTAAVVEHDVRVGDFAQIAPAAAIGGGAAIGARSYLGLGCRVRDHVSVGEGALVAMGAVVTSPVPGGVTVKGVPAKE
jgi:acetyltransferase EpsM